MCTLSLPERPGGGGGGGGGCGDGGSGEGGLNLLPNFPKEWGLDTTPVFRWG